MPCFAPLPGRIKSSRAAACVLTRMGLIFVAISIILM
jgi:hypothetical protein